MTRLRVALHAHTTWSYDGRLSIDELAVALRRRGYRAVLTSEHEDGFDDTRWQDYRAACAEATRRTKVLIVPGIEYADPDNVVHVPVWGDLPFLGARRPTSELLEEVTHREGAAMIAHPRRRNAADRISSAWISQACGLEVWNRKTDGWAPGAGARDLLAASPSGRALAGIDLHTRRQLFPLAAVLRLEGPSSEATVVAALRAGRFQATALGLPLSWFLREPLWSATRLAESARRPAARAIRRALNRRAA